MKDDEPSFNFWILTFGIVIGLVIALATARYVIYKECPTCEKFTFCEEPQIAQGKAILDVQMYQQAINELDDSEMFFDYWIYNFGDAEAKDVKVTCKLFDDKNNVAKIATDTKGNLASHSGELGEIITSRPAKLAEGKMVTGICYVESCNNCDILYKRIPNLVEIYEVK